MINIKGVGDFFSLDIGTNAIRAVQLSKAGENSWNLVGLGYTPVDPQLVLSNSDESRRRLGEIISTMIGQSDIKTKNVAISLTSQKTFTTIFEVPKQDMRELQKNIKYQVDQYIPMAVDDAQVDWAPLGESPSNPDSLEILLASTAKTYSEEKMEFIEGLGLNVVASEPDSLAMTRALFMPNQSDQAQLIIDMGELSTDLSIVYQGVPRLVRTIPTGISSLVKSATQNLNIKEDQARQFIMKFGLAQDKLEGQVFRAIEMTLENFVQEIAKSIKFLGTKYQNAQVGVISLSGFSGIIPQMPEYVSSKTGIQSYSANPFQNINVPAKYQQQVASVGNEFAVAVGLAERSNK